MSKLATLRLQRQIAVKRLLHIKELAIQASCNSNLHSLFRIKVEDAEVLRKEFNDFHVQLLCLLKEYDFDVEEETRKEVDEAYDLIRTTAKSLFPVVAPPASSNTDSSTTRCNQTVKLPKISLPHFDGDLKLWSTFRDMFDTMIHSNNSLSNVEKFQYLVASLSKSPLAIVTHVPVTEANYIVAYQSLLERYQNKRLLATNYWHEIQNAAPLQTDSPSSLRQLLDIFQENLAALKVLKFPVGDWDFVLFNLLLDKLDTETRKAFEREHSQIELPSFDQLKMFLSNLANALSRVPTCSRERAVVRSSKSHVENSVVRTPRSAFINTTSRKQSCLICKADHPLYRCSSFLKKSPRERYLFTKDKSLCLNCLRASHTSKDCPSSLTCRTCNAFHHSLLHFGSKSQTSSTISQETAPCSSQNVAINTSSLPTATSSVESGPTQTVLTNTVFTQTTVLLSTALVEVTDAWGKHQPVRVLLDSASQASFISEQCCQRLGLARAKTSIPIQGLAQLPSLAAKGITNCRVRPRNQNQPSLGVECIILQKICADLPSAPFDSSKWDHISNLKLADPNFNIPNKIDMLLGAEIFPLILQTGRVTGGTNEPIAIKTIFGWILMGSISYKTPVPINSLYLTIDEPLDPILKRFWELEEVPVYLPPSPDESRCEDIFQREHFRTASGRYGVALPFKGPEPGFHDSRALALRRFGSLERRLLENPSLHQLYVDFMEDYINSGHMELIKNPSPSEKSYYIPHHCVLKPDSTTTKLRVVFDASAKTLHNTSLNDHLLIGPKLQKDILTILLHFRLHPIVFTADIKQMYRQILINRLNTVTYGVSSAPFLALRTINQLAIDEAKHYPLASKILQSDIYVDDIVTGASSLETALTLQQQLTNLLKKGGFELRKWASNSPEVLAALPDSFRQQPLSFNSEPNVAIKILGLQWLPAQDIFSYKVSVIDGPCTKRVVLSELAKIFDPLGFLSPLTFFAKHLIQHFWCLGLDWDATPPSDICDVWAQYKAQLPDIAKLQINRPIKLETFTSCELHGFCDASELGYAAVLYVRVVRDSLITTSLICAKSKVTPLKRVSIPRLELCGALLLSNLTSFVIQTYSPLLTFSEIFAWTDSTVVLSWLNSSPHKWKTFVSNRVTLIQQLIPPKSWHHVRSGDNPADCASRGLLPTMLQNHPLWWHGPSWLQESKSSWSLADSTNCSAFNTVLVQIEAVLNSRPLCEVSSDPNDPSVLTPGHFLTLEPLTVVPESDLTDLKVNRLSRWQLLQRLHQDFWKRWHREYLHTLQQRQKWNTPSSQPSPGMLVLIIDNTVSPLQWRLGRVEKLHPGAVGICRVVTLKTKFGSLQRPVTKICPLPSAQ